MGTSLRTQFKSKQFPDLSSKDTVSGILALSEKCTLPLPLTSSLGAQDYSNAQGKGVVSGTGEFCRLEGRQSPSDAWVHFRSKALNSCLCRSQCKAEERRDTVQEAFPPHPAWLCPKRRDMRVLGAEYSGAINGDSIALARAPLSSRGTRSQPRQERVSSPLALRDPGPPRNSHGALLPPGGTGREPPPRPAPAPGLREGGPGFHATGIIFQKLVLTPSFLELFAPKTEGAWARWNGGDIVAFPTLRNWSEEPELWKSSSSVKQNTLEACQRYGGLPQTSFCCFNSFC